MTIEDLQTANHLTKLIQLKERDLEVFNKNEIAVNIVGYYSNNGNSQMGLFNSRDCGNAKYEELIDALINEVKTNLEKDIESLKTQLASL